MHMLPAISCHFRRTRSKANLCQTLLENDSHLTSAGLETSTLSVPQHSNNVQQHCCWPPIDITRFSFNGNDHHAHHCTAACCRGCFSAPASHRTLANSHPQLTTAQATPLPSLQSWVGVNQRGKRRPPCRANATTPCAILHDASHCAASAALSLTPPPAFIPSFAPLTVLTPHVIDY